MENDPKMAPVGLARCSLFSLLFATFLGHRFLYAPGPARSTPGRHFEGNFVAFGRFWLPFGSTLVAFGTLSAHFGIILAAFGSILDPLGSIFDKNPVFWVPEFANHLQIAVRTSIKGNLPCTHASPTWPGAGTCRRQLGSAPGRGYTVYSVPEGRASVLGSD